MKKRMKNNLKQIWGGNWTEEKLSTFEAYVNAYLTIMQATRNKFNGWPEEIIYFDGFAGSGQKEVKKENNKLIQYFFIENENQVYKGSAERVLQLEKKFDVYYFIDLDKNSLEKLENLLKNKNLCSSNCKFICGDANIAIENLTQSFNNQKVALVLLDPFGMQVKWESIEKMKDKRIDLWILVPSGVIINRFLDKDGKLEFLENLESFFGLPEKEIKEYFYEKKKESTLFGEIQIQQKIPQSINKIAHLYVERLNTIFKYVTEKPLELKNSKNVTIYHFIFASNNKAAYKIASQIITRKQKRN